MESTSEPSANSPASARRGFWFRGFLFFAIGCGVGWWLRGAPKPTTAPVVAPKVALDSFNAGEDNAGADEGVTGIREVPMADVLTLAEDALANLIANVDGYTTRLIKHEQDRSGVLQEPSEMFMKLRTRHVGGKPGGALAVYLKFESPDAAKGREVIWVEDQNDGNLLVREAGFVGSMMTAKLAPTNFLAMRGQRYPITEIGLTNLVRKLIARGSRDIDNPDVRVLRTPNHDFDGKALTLLQIQRAKPSDDPDDFSLAEVVIDEMQQLVVSFRSFGWPKKEGESPPLIESYEYRDLTLNPPLTDQDFDPANPDYTFPQ